MGRDAAKKRVKRKPVNEEWNEFKQYKEKELERLDKISMRQEEGNQLLKESIDAKKMKMFVKISSKEYLGDRSKELWKSWVAIYLKIKRCQIVVCILSLCVLSII